MENSTEKTTVTETQVYERSGMNFGTRVVSVQLSRSYLHYQKKIAATTGALQILFSLFSIALGISQPIISCTFGDSAYGIWCGVMYLLAGIVGIITYSKKESGWIVAHMVFSILASLLAGLMFSLAVAAAAFDNLSRLSNNIRIHDNKGVAYGNMVAVDCLLAIFAFFEALTAIVAAAISCRVTCCSNKFIASQEEIENPNIMSYNTREYTVNPTKF